MLTIDRFPYREVELLRDGKSVGKFLCVSHRTCWDLMENASNYGPVTSVKTADAYDAPYACALWDPTDRSRSMCFVLNTTSFAHISAAMFVGRSNKRLLIPEREEEEAYSKAAGDGAARKDVRARVQGDNKRIAYVVDFEKDPDLKRETAFQRGYYTRITDYWENPEDRAVANEIFKEIKSSWGDYGDDNYD